MFEGSHVERMAFVGGTAVLGGVTVRSETVGRWTWAWHADDGAALPLESAPLDTTPPVSAYTVPESADGGPLLMGVDYAIPITDFCAWLSYLGTFGGTIWRSDDIGDRIDPSWPTRTFEKNSYSSPVVYAYGVAELVADDLVEYSIPGIGVVGTFHPGTAGGLPSCG